MSKSLFAEWPERPRLDCCESEDRQPEVSTMGFVAFRCSKCGGHSIGTELEQKVFRCGLEEARSIVIRNLFSST